jgi:hypothetical protein
MVTSIKMAAFWDVAPCSLVDINQSFRDAYCLHHQGDHHLYLPDYMVLLSRSQPSSKLDFWCYLLVPIDYEISK